MDELESVWEKVELSRVGPRREILFNEEELENSVVNFCEYLEQTFPGTKVRRLDDGWWSGSLYAAFVFLDPPMQSVALRFSKIGHLASIAPELQVEQEMLDTLKRMIEAAGFVYVQENKLKELVPGEGFSWDIALFGEA